MLKQLLLCSLALVLVMTAPSAAPQPRHRPERRAHAPSPVARPAPAPEATARPATPEPDVPEPPPTPPPARLEDTAELTAFFEGVMQLAMERHHATGAVVALVKDGRELLARGYGHADLSKGTPIDPATSLFRIGDITSAFTWTAVMQLAEQGRVELDKDVSSYLKGMRLPVTRDPPITLHSLMTHTAGFEDVAFGLALTQPEMNAKGEKRQPPGILDVVRLHIPARVRAPEQMPAYSRYGVALAGLVVEQVSGMPYNDFIERQVFAPLKMNHATVQEPVPDKLERDLTTGYRFESGMQLAQPFEMTGAFRPAGSASVSARDMTHFMLAQLQGGRYEDRQVLKPESVQRMQGGPVKMDERFPGMTPGFSELDLNGHPALGLRGDTLRYHSDLVLMPKENFGIFLSFIAQDGESAFISPATESPFMTRDSEIVNEVEQAFFARYFPRREAGPPRLDDTIALLLAAKYSGQYQVTRRNQAELDKVLDLVRGIRVSSLGNGNLLVSGVARQPLQFEPVKSDLYREVLHGDLLMAFRSDKDSQPTHLFFNNYPSLPAERTPWYEQTLVWMAALGGVFAVLLSTLASTYYRSDEIRAMPPVQQRAIGAAAILAAWALATALVLGGVLASTDVETLLTRIPLALTLGLAMPIVFVGLTVWVLVMAVIAWQGGFWSLGRRIGYSLTAGAGIVLCLFFWQWNLLGWRFG